MFSSGHQEGTSLVFLFICSYLLLTWFRSTRCRESVDMFEMGHKVIKVQDNLIFEANLLQSKCSHFRPEKRSFSRVHTQKPLSLGVLLEHGSYRAVPRSVKGIVTGSDCSRIQHRVPLPPPPATLVPHSFFCPAGAKLVIPQNCVGVRCPTLIISAS